MSIQEFPFLYGEALIVSPLNSNKAEHIINKNADGWKLSPTVLSNFKGYFKKAKRKLFT